VAHGRWPSLTRLRAAGPGTPVERDSHVPLVPDMRICKPTARDGRPVARDMWPRAARDMWPSDPSGSRTPDKSTRVLYRKGQSPPSLPTAELLHRQKRRRNGRKGPQTPILATTRPNPSRRRIEIGGDFGMGVKRLGRSNCGSIGRLPRQIVQPCPAMAQQRCRQNGHKCRQKWNKTEGGAGVSEQRARRQRSGTAWVY
jgi:hypothetical protein